MKILRKINQFCGLVSAISFVLLTADIIFTRSVNNGQLFYYCAAAFIIFGLIFILTAAIFILYDFITHVRNKQLVLFIRHYFYAFVGFYMVCILADYVLNGIIDWPGYAHYAMVLALIQTYLSGFRSSVSASQNKTAS